MPNETLIGRGIQFFIPCVPPKTTSQMKRVTMIGEKPRFFKGKAQAESETFFEAMLLEHRPDRPLEAPIRLTVRLVFPWRKSEKKRVIAFGHAPHLAKPDLDNWLKGFTDSLARQCFIRDDSGISELVASKSYGDVPGIWVNIEEVPNGMV